VKHVPVLIAGGGPVGMTLARTLAQFGVRCLLVERNASTTRHPKMDITNGRSMELFRRIGVADKLRAVAVPEENNFDVSWITSLTGRELHRFKYPSVTEKRAEILRKNDGTQPREPAMRVSQVVIEPVLRDAISNDPLIDARWGVAFEDFVQDETGVTATLRTMETGATETVRCDFLVGCDGGSSLVREKLGIGLDGRAAVTQRYMIHFRSDAREILQAFGVAPGPCRRGRRPASIRWRSIPTRSSTPGWAARSRGRSWSPIRGPRICCWPSATRPAACFSPGTLRTNTSRPAATA
jgi:2-polyprenyl-6-methoxyphenol hydroxylase-like FAD-dependent oxidoreductase